MKQARCRHLDMSSLRSIWYQLSDDFNNKLISRGKIYLSYFSFIWIRFGPIPQYLDNRGFGVVKSTHFDPGITNWTLSCQSRESIYRKSLRTTPSKCNQACNLTGRSTLLLASSTLERLSKRPRPKPTSSSTMPTTLSTANSRGRIPTLPVSSPLLHLHWSPKTKSTRRNPSTVQLTRASRAITTTSRSEQIHAIQLTSVNSEYDVVQREANWT